MASARRGVILRSDIEELTSTGKSAMPEGLEEGMTAQDLADVIACVRRGMTAAQ
ncbi:MAG: hypothetical protein WD851_22275 [Pirellulales bacterium]